jgi:hypothetical protein
MFPMPLHVLTSQFSRFVGWRSVVSAMRNSGLAFLCCSCVAVRTTAVTPATLPELSEQHELEVRFCVVRSLTVMSNGKEAVIDNAVGVVGRLAATTPDGVLLRELRVLRHDRSRSKLYDQAHVALADQCAMLLRRADMPRTVVMSGVALLLAMTFAVAGAVNQGFR